MCWYRMQQSPRRCRQVLAAWQVWISCKDRVPEPPRIRRVYVTRVPCFMLRQLCFRQQEAQRLASHADAALHTHTHRADERLESMTRFVLVDS
eukprot:3854633-Amphidinium_carterae.2